MPSRSGVRLVLRFVLATIAATAGCRSRPASPTVYVSNERDGSVSVIDVATDRIVDTIRLGSRARGIQVAPDNRSLCVALSKPVDGREGRDRIVCLDADSHEELAEYDAGSDPESFALGVDGKHLYVANEDAGTASTLRLVDRATATAFVGFEPEGVAVSPDGRWVYVTAETSSTVSVLDAATGDVVKSFLVGARPRDATFRPDGTMAFVSAENGSSIAFVDTATHSVVDTVVLPMEGEQPARPKGLACSPDGKRLYVATGRADTVAVIDVDARRVLEQIPVGRRPWGIALSPDGSKLYTANGLSDDVSVIDTGRNVVVATLACGSGPWGVAVRR